MIEDKIVPMSSSPISSREKLYDIERAKGLAIILVVYGHLVMAGTLGVQQWYVSSADLIYTFHMPLFMYLSGFIFFYTKSHLVFPAKYLDFAIKRVDRLMVPFIAVAALIIAGKILAGQFIHVDDGVTSFSGGLYAALVNTPDNPSVSIWYLLVLFVLSLLVPPLWKLLGGRFPILIALAFVVFFLPVTENYYVARITRFFIFFVLGMASAAYFPKVREVFERYFWVFVAVFAATLFIGRNQSYPLLVCGLASIPVFHQLVRMRPLSQSRALAWLGENSMVIYLFNTICIGVVKGVYAKVLPYEGPWFFLMIAVLMVGGLGLPLAFKFILRAIPGTGPAYKYIR